MRVQSQGVWALAVWLGVLVLCVVAVGVTWGSAGSGIVPGVTEAAKADADGLTARAAPSLHEVVPARRTGAVRPEVPSRSVLPDGTRVPIKTVGTTRHGSLAVPDDIRTAGWWRGGARLGDPFGSMLLAAHVDSFTQGLGPFASLLTVRPGQRITVSSPHLTQVFSVVSLSLVPRNALVGHPRIFSAAGPPRLTMVTCAGPYDAARGGYQNLAVVTALPVHGVASRSDP